jgi:predicted transcriptional regulator
MIETLISSKTRVKLLMKFFLNSSTTAYLRSLEEEFGESTNGIRLELNKFEKAGFIDSETQGNKKYSRPILNILCLKILTTSS